MNFVAHQHQRQPGQLVVLVASTVLALSTSAIAVNIGPTIGTQITFHGGGPSQAVSSAASSEVRNAQRQITRVVSDLRRAFESSDELRNARTHLADASTTYQTAVIAAKAGVNQTPAYRSASEQIIVAERQLATLRSDEHATPAQMQSAISQLLNARVNVSNLDAQAIAGNADVESARNAWMEANAALLDVQRNFEASIQTSPEFRAAKTRLEGARRQLARD